MLLQCSQVTATAAIVEVLQDYQVVDGEGDEAEGREGPRTTATTAAAIIAEVFRQVHLTEGAEGAQNLPLIAKKPAVAIMTKGH